MFKISRVCIKSIKNSSFVIGKSGFLKIFIVERCMIILNSWRHHMFEISRVCIKSIKMAHSVIGKSAFFKNYFYCWTLYDISQSFWTAEGAPLKQKGHNATRQAPKRMDTVAHNLLSIMRNKQEFREYLGINLV